MTSQKTTTALILAAGSGRRLGNKFDNAPKGFIRFGGIPIIQRSMHILNHFGIERFMIVTGYAEQFYVDLRNRSPYDITLTTNHEFATTGTLCSLNIGLQALADSASGLTDALVVESDLLYDSQSVEILLNADHNDLILVSGATLAGDEVYVSHHKQQLKRLSKNKEEHSHEVLGEFVGLSRWSVTAQQWFMQHARTRLTENTNADYESAMAALATQQPVSCLLKEDLVWTEIDDATHLERATNVVYPWLLCNDALTQSSEELS